MLLEVNSDFVFTIVIFTIMLLVLVIGIMLTVFVASKQRARQEIRLTQARVEYEQELRIIQTEVQEQVLTQISDELHDNIGQLLTVIQLQLEREKLRHPEHNTLLNSLSESLQNVFTQVRQLSHSLSQDFIGDNSLQTMVAREIERIQSFCKQKIHFEMDESEPILSKDKRIVAFRSFQESISNALRHANASNIYVALYGKCGFMLQVRDDGEGLDKNGTVIATNGLGIKNMLRRSAMAGFDCQIETATGKGYSITFASRENGIS